MNKGGWLAWKLCREGVVTNTVVNHRGIIGLKVYQREEGEETVNTEQTEVPLSMS